MSSPVFKSSTRTWAELHERAFRRLGGAVRVVVLDNLSNSKSDSLSRIEEMTGKEIQFHLADLRDKADVIVVCLEGDRTWDAVIDASGMNEAWTRDSAQLLKNKAKQYIFVSSISVFADFSQKGNDEDSPVGTLTDGPHSTLARPPGHLHFRAFFRRRWSAKSFFQSCLSVTGKNGKARSITSSSSSPKCSRPRTISRG